MSNNNKGFTLVELLIAISIVAILSGILIGSINIPKQMAKSRDVVRREELAIVAGALERYYADNNQYPQSATYIDADSGVIATALETDYIREIPVDPNDVAYSYQTPDSQNFCLCAQMEDLDTADTGSCSPPSGYNYCIENTF